jgi:hypothetical protein
VRSASPSRADEVIDDADPLAANYLAVIKLASIRLWIRAYEFTP